MTFEPVPPAVEQIATEAIGAAIEVHRHLGPGFLERIYQEALCAEFRTRRIPFERECSVTVNYKGLAIGRQRIDLIVDRCVIVELKAATRIDVVHESKVISYLRTTGLRLGLLLNFNCRTMKEGLKRSSCKPTTATRTQSMRHEEHDVLATKSTKDAKNSL